MDFDFKKFKIDEIDTIIKGYEGIRKNAIADRQVYENFWQEGEKLSKEELEQLGVWKHNLYKCLKAFMTLYTTSEFSETEKHKKLVKTMILFIKNGANSEISENFKQNYAVLYLMLDIIWAYAEKNDKFRLSAIMYDIISQMNQSDPDLEKFYGKTAKEQIISHTFDCVKIICEQKDVDIYQYMNVFYGEKQDFLRTFMEQLERVCKQEYEQNKKKDWLLKIVQISAVIIIGVLIFIGGFCVGQITTPLKTQLEKKQEEIGVLQNELKSYKEKLKQYEEGQSFLESDLNTNNEQGNVEVDSGTNGDGENNEVDSGINGDGENNEVDSGTNDEEESNVSDSNTNSEQNATSFSKRYVLKTDKNLREEKNTDSTILKKLLEGNEIIVLEEMESVIDWKKVQWEEDGEVLEGYLYIKLSELEEVLEDIEQEN